MIVVSTGMVASDFEKPASSEALKLSLKACSMVPEIW